MDLYSHAEPSFTQWVVANKLLHDPFVVVDVGVQGGEHPRWEHLGVFAHIHGFDAIHEVIDGLKAAHRERPTRSYYAMALGNEDGQRDFHVAGQPYESSFFTPDRFQTGERNGIALGSRTVDIRRLDTLFADGTLPPADCLKLDCEGFEPEVLRGGKAYLARSNILCVMVESNFGVSPLYPRTPFAEISDLLVEHGLFVFDVSAVRTARPTYTAARAADPWPPTDPMNDAPDLDVGSPGTFDFLFCRDFVRELTSPDSYRGGYSAPAPPTADKLIKSMINFELYGLMDCAVDTAVHFRPVLAERFDVDLAIKHLLRRPTMPRNTSELVNALSIIAPLRRQVKHWRTEAEAATRELHATETKLTSVRFLAKALARETAARMRQRGKR